MAEKIKPPRMRMPRRIKQDQVFKMKVRFDHPSFTGLGMVNENEFNRATPSTFIRNMLGLLRRRAGEPLQNVFGDRR